MAQETSPTTNPELTRPVGTAGRSAARFEKDVSDIYDELRRLGARLRRTERDVTLTTAQVVRDVCARAEGWPGVTQEDPQSYRRAAAKAMRLLLVKAARSETRLGGATKQTPGAEAAESGSLPPEATQSRVLSLDAALNELNLLDSYQADLLEMKYFGGYSLDETAEHLHLPEEKVARDLRVAEAWLKIRLRHLT